MMQQRAAIARIAGVLPHARHVSTAPPSRPAAALMVGGYTPHARAYDIGRDTANGITSKDNRGQIAIGRAAADLHGASKRRALRFSAAHKWTADQLRIEHELRQSRAMATQAGGNRPLERSAGVPEWSMFFHAPSPPPAPAPVPCTEFKSPTARQHSTAATAPVQSKVPSWSMFWHPDPEVERSDRRLATAANAGPGSGHPPGSERESTKLPNRSLDASTTVGAIKLSTATTASPDRQVAKHIRNLPPARKLGTFSGNHSNENSEDEGLHDWANYFLRLFFPRR